MPRGFSGFVLSSIVSFLMALIIPSFFPKLEINFFVPPLVMSLYFLSQPAVLWYALFIGFGADSLYLSPRFGFFAASYLVTMMIIYRFRLYFFKEEASSLAIMTYLV